MHLIFYFSNGVEQKVTYNPDYVESFEALVHTLFKIPSHYDLIFTHDELGSIDGHALRNGDHYCVTAFPPSRASSTSSTSTLPHEHADRAEVVAKAQKVFARSKDPEEIQFGKNLAAILRETDWSTRDKDICQGQLSTLSSKTPKKHRAKIMQDVKATYEASKSKKAAKKVRVVVEDDEDEGPSVKRRNRRHV
eukprot:TRINITY_DN7830_c0_g1_i1.p1 TRINITY_DN7830_c0_g1~~TRINITY_DN7830_c0_g1_i1.p1  ORF type:complete len:193 (+),score=20.88 TRINITY_DN7830_c0_g1_i1:96-674(+)